MNQDWLDRYGGKISSEWFFSKTLQILNEAPEIYQAADRLIEAADWVVWQLTGVETRNSCTAGYKAIWSKRDGFPSNDPACDYLDLQYMLGDSLLVAPVFTHDGSVNYLSLPGAGQVS